MKKTLIALAVAASAAVSGSAMAWTANGTGGQVEMGGTLIPADVITPWEVKTGDAVTNLDGQIKKGQQTVAITVNNAIPVLGIRTQTNDAFQGQAGITPQIDYHGSVDMSQSLWGKAPVTLEVFDNASNKIGSLQTTLTTAAVYSSNNNGADHQYGALAANTAGTAFFGGLSSLSKALGYSDAVNVLNQISSEFLEKYNQQGATIENGMSLAFANVNYTYSAAYGSGITQGTAINITLDQAASNDSIQWKASLPITVSYR
ncbi:hypothetical protein QSE07_004742 [Escherichia coli]|nr:hypothetical protein [Escherichia coli]